MKWNNLDLRCAETAEKIVGHLQNAKKPPKRQEVNKSCTDAGAVLSEHGLYACFLYLWTDKTQVQIQIRSEIRRSEYAMLAEVFKDTLQILDATDKAKVLGGIRKLSEDLNSLMLAKRLMGQVLAYTRYHAKGMRDAEDTAIVSAHR